MFYYYDPSEQKENKRQERTNKKVQIISSIFLDMLLL